MSNGGLPESHWHLLGEAMTWIVLAVLGGASAASMWFVRLVMRHEKRIGGHDVMLLQHCARMNCTAETLKEVGKAKAVEHDVLIKLVADVSWIKDKVGAIEKQIERQRG
jgi:hypothetical protein